MPYAGKDGEEEKAGQRERARRTERELVEFLYEDATSTRKTALQAAQRHDEAG